MSAAMTMPEQIDGLEKLITLASLRREDIIATQEEARRQLQLTQEDEGKLAEAKAYIAKHSALVAELATRENKLASDQAAHNQAVGEFSAHVSSENTRLETFAADNAAKEKDIEAEWKKLAEAQGIHKATVDEHERQNKAAAEANAAATSANERAKIANEKEVNRLQEWENMLKAKAKRLRDSAEKEIA